jgi:hypothetical protein
VQCPRQCSARNLQQRRKTQPFLNRFPNTMVQTSGRRTFSRRPTRQCPPSAARNTSCKSTFARPITRITSVRQNDLPEALLHSDALVG